MPFILAYQVITRKIINVSHKMFMAKQNYLEKNLLRNLTLL